MSGVIPNDSDSKGTHGYLNRRYQNVVRGEWSRRNSFKDMEHRLLRPDTVSLLCLRLSCRTTTGPVYVPIVPHFRPDHRSKDRVHTVVVVNSLLYPSSMAHTRVHIIQTLRRSHVYRVELDSPGPTPLLKTFRGHS